MVHPFEFFTLLVVQWYSQRITIGEILTRPPIGTWKGKMFLLGPIVPVPLNRDSSDIEICPNEPGKRGLRTEPARNQFPFGMSGETCSIHVQRVRMPTARVNQDLKWRSILHDQ